MFLQESIVRMTRQQTQIRLSTIYREEEASCALGSGGLMTIQRPPLPGSSTLVYPQ